MQATSPCAAAHLALTARLPPDMCLHKPRPPPCSNVWYPNVCSQCKAGFTLKNYQASLSNLPPAVLHCAVSFGGRPDCCSWFGFTHPLAHPATCPTCHLPNLPLARPAVSLQCQAASNSWGSSRWSSNTWGRTSGSNTRSSYNWWNRG